jgi:hypothetical protein
MRTFAPFSIDSHILGKLSAKANSPYSHCRINNP